MSATISGISLGLSATSNTTVGAVGQARTGSDGENVYVNASTGNLVVQRQDELLVGRGLDAGILRTYNSQGLSDEDNGDNWRLGFHRRIKNFVGPLDGAGSSVVRVDADGAELTYTWDGSRYLNMDGGGSYDTLSYDSEKQLWTWTDGDSRVTELYNWDPVAVGVARLLSQTDADGNTTSFSYNADNLLSRITTANSTNANLNITVLNWDTNGGKTANLLSITSTWWDAASNSNQTLTRVRYAYDSSNRLSTVTVDLSPQDGSVDDGNSYITHYDYDGSSNRVTGISQSDGSNLVIAYTSDYKVASITDALGNQTRYAYDDARRETTVTDARGNLTNIQYDALGQMTYAGAGLEYIEYAYDTVGNRARQRSVTRGFPDDIRNYAYDSMNRQILVDGVNNNDVNDASNISATQGHVLGYDLNGNRLSDNSRVEGNYRYGYDALGRLTTINDAEVRRYDAADRVVWGMTAPDNNVVTLYRDFDFSGVSQQFDGYLGSRIDMGQLGQVGNDSVSSLRVKPGWTATLYSDDQFIGQQRVVSANTSSLDSAFNDTLSSLTILPNSYINTWNAAGDLVAQDMFAGDRNQTVHIDNSYDNAHKLIRSTRQTLATGGLLETTIYGYVKVDGYQQDSISASRDDNPGQSGGTDFGYDVNGYLTRITDRQGQYAERDFINDASGQILQKSQGGNVLGNLVANGQVLRYAGSATNPDTPVNADGSVNYTMLNDSNIAWQAIDTAHPGNAPAQVRVNAGDTLQSIAQAVYGDSALWYLIADANGLQSNADLQTGQMLSVPNRVGTVHNNAGSFKPFNASLVIGDTSPYVPAPAGNSGPSCGQIAIIIAAVLAAVVVAVATAGAAAPVLAGAFGALGMSAAASTIAAGAVAGAVGGALGSIASQGIMMAGGLQSRFSWTDVAIGAVSGLIGGGIAGRLKLAADAARALGAAGQELSLGQKLLMSSLRAVKEGRSTYSLLAARTAVTSAGNAVQNMAVNAVGQGIKIAARQQTSFQWSQVAASAVTGAFSGAGTSIGRAGAVAGDIAGSAVGNVIVNEGAFDPTQFVADVSSSFGSALIGGVDLGGADAQDGAARGKGRGPALNRFVAVSRKNGGNNYASSTRTNRAGTQAIVAQAGNNVVVLSGLHGGKGPTQYIRERAFYEQDLTVDKRPGQTVGVFDVFNPATRADMLEAMNQRNTDVVYAYCFSRGKTMFTRRPSVAGELNNYWERTPPN